MTSNTSNPILTPSFNKILVLLLSALTGTLLIALVVSNFGFPEPFVHDEFAYLLGADTFLEGRLTNPTPPMPEFFETFHVNMTPTYHSKYPPAQSVFLALGKLLSGMEIYGVWLSFILTAVAIVWALLAVAPPKWAFLGGLLAIANSTVIIKWAFSFWGGSVAMLGGTLFMGGLLRLYQSSRVAGAVWVSIGLLIMAFSRPLEGLITAAILLIFYAGTLLKRGRDLSEVRKNFKVLAVLAMAGLMIFGMNLFYNRALTGSAFTFPHANWNPNESVHDMIRAYQGSQRTSVWFRLNRYFSVFIGPFLWLPALLALRRYRDPRILSAAVMLLVVSIYTAITSRAWPHYIAPVVPFMIGLQVTGCMILCRWRIGSTRLGMIILLIVLSLHFGHQYTNFLSEKNTIDFKTYRENGAVFKRDVDKKLENIPGSHLVLVRYLEGHNLHFDFVYNRADIPSARVIWARGMRPEQNRLLVEQYPDRIIWLANIRNFSVDIKKIRGVTDHL